MRAGASRKSASRAFEIAGYPPEEVEDRFGSLLNAFRFGAPPHGGIAPGIDRIVMLLAEETNIKSQVAVRYLFAGQNLDQLFFTA